jgi:hypothetical protein
MPARIFTLCAVVMGFFRFKQHRQEPDVEKLLLNALNKTNRDWAARGLIEK